MCSFLNLKWKLQCSFHCFRLDWIRAAAFLYFDSIALNVQISMMKRDSKSRLSDTKQNEMITTLKSARMNNSTLKIKSTASTGLPKWFLFFFLHFQMNFNHEKYMKNSEMNMLCDINFISCWFSNIFFLYNYQFSTVNFWNLSGTETATTKIQRPNVVYTDVYQVEKKEKNTLQNKQSIFLSMLI